MDTCSIFYSWQSDIKDSRNFISDCLKRLPKKLRELSVIEIDRDTAGVAGSPNIGDTIYKKIDQCDIFVADVTIINADEKGRKTPNPNVMIELGYAIKALGWDRIILLYNKDYGDVEKLPFDINHQRMRSYSLVEEEKPEAREKVVTSFAITIEILKSRGILHGGNPLLSSARKDFAGTLYEAMKRVYRYYVEWYCQEKEERYTNFVVITDAQFEKLDILRDYLDEEQYFELTILLQKLKMAGTGSDEAYGWESAEEIADEYFESLFREYANQMKQLSLEQVLTLKFIELYNAVVGEEQLIWEAERKIDGELVFKDDGCFQEVYDKEHELLCKGQLVDGFFSGYKSTCDYKGMFEKSKRQGEGEELTSRRNRHVVRIGTVRKKGEWNDNQLVKGTIFDVLLFRAEDGEYELEIVGEKENLITADHEALKWMIDSGGWLEEESENYYFADVAVEDGEFRMIDETLKPFRSLYLYSDMMGS